MFTPYTPTTDDLRTQYAQRFPDVEGAKQDFDRWLAAHDAQVAGDALREFGGDLGHYIGTILNAESASDMAFAKADRIAGGTSHE